MSRSCFNVIVRGEEWRKGMMIGWITDGKEIPEKAEKETKI
jgi:hypothetical protein